MDPKQYANYQDPSSSGSLDIVLTRFSYCNYSKLLQRGITLSIFYGIRSKLILNCISNIRILVKRFSSYRVDKVF